MSLANSSTKFSPRRFGKGLASPHEEARKQVRFEQAGIASDEVASSDPTSSSSRVRTQRAPDLHAVYPYSLSWFVTLAIIVYLFVRDGWAALITSGDLPIPFQRSWSTERGTLDDQIISPTLLARIEELILSALNPVPLRDYALAADGGMIFDELTWSYPGSLSSQPELALEDDMRVGQCWHFSGSRGQIAISLPVFIHPTHVSIDHIPRAIAADVGQAPRRMTLWGLIDGTENRERYVAQMYALRATSALDRVHPPLTKEDYLFVELAHFVYNITEVRTVQTFALREEVQELGIDIGLVVLEVMDNWGSDSTCLYRVRVHGTEGRNNLNSIA